ncbi:type III toxin-antitoxin system ToxN/AbiQ family toxin [Saccharibacillus sp. CPCC 101409]|uniref:type III toxin-antitoxin system ToxN/AbiQ family toxin n=1 Tax=Saccharibacillus sp. CPCC 101409 TaxID=3058041 RepID=UPI002671C95C|nr:type III toxin-antitoxin system ToxN/AbiQ family toxin [Saccharibacillus sp. CPCC 101409]MDO3411026.1 type III toxin-antitoxin system ToxN/AbiQ family toxin [Saccharibacillus sp. CPCC 101409]
MRFYRLKNEYVNYLKTFDSKMQDNYDGTRAYAGIVVRIGLHNYFAPLSSHKKSQDKYKKNDTIFKLHSRTNENDKLGLIHINNMIPVLPTELEEIIFSNEEKKYSTLLQKQYEFILSNEKNINEQAERLYKRVVERKESFFVRLSCDFQLLEKKYLLFNKTDI